MSEKSRQDRQDLAASIRHRFDQQQRQSSIMFVVLVLVVLGALALTLLGQFLLS